MPISHASREPAPSVQLALTPDQVKLLAYALALAIDHYTRHAEELRKKSETAMTIGHRRRAQAQAFDVLTHARSLDAIRRSLAL